MYLILLCFNYCFHTGSRWKVLPLKATKDLNSIVEQSTNIDSQAIFLICKGTAHVAYKELQCELTYINLKCKGCSLRTEINHVGLGLSISLHVISENSDGSLRVWNFMSKQKNLTEYFMQHAAVEIRRAVLSAHEPRGGISKDYLGSESRICEGDTSISSEVELTWKVT